MGSGDRCYSSIHNKHIFWSPADLLHILDLKLRVSLVAFIMVWMCLGENSYVDLERNLQAEVGKYKQKKSKYLDKKEKRRNKLVVISG